MLGYAAASNQFSGSLQPLQMGDTVKGSYRSQKPEVASRALPASALCDCPDMQASIGEAGARLVLSLLMLLESVP